VGTFLCSDLREPQLRAVELTVTLLHPTEGSPGKREKEEEKKEMKSLKGPTSWTWQRERKKIHLHSLSLSYSV
jgi:hypothetical protein